MYQKIINLLKENKFVLLLILIAFLSHRSWFNPDSILSYSDWYYWPKSAVDELLLSWGTWINQWNGLGEPNIQIYFNSIYSFWSFLSNLGIGYDISSKINLLIPIALLGFITPYFFIRYLLKDELISFVCALFYGSTTYFLVLQLSHLPIAFVYSLAPLIVHLFMMALERNKLINWILFTFVYSIGAMYEVRIIYIVSLILFICFLLTKDKKIKEYIPYIIITGIFILLLNLFWILPMVMGGGANAIGEILERGLFGNSLTNANYAFTISHWSWTGFMPNDNFEPQKIKLNLWLITLLIFLFLALGQKINKFVIFFLTLTVMGIFLTKQTSNPFPLAYNILFDFFPGFSLFRESSKFFLLTSLGYLGLLGYLLLYLKEKTTKSNFKKILYILLILVIILINFQNLKPYFDKSIRGLTIDRIIHDDYEKLNKIIMSEPEFSRILYIPAYSRWVSFDSQHARLGGIMLINSSWSDYLKRIKFTDETPESEKMIRFLQADFSENLLSQSSVKYVVIPVNDNVNDDGFFKYFGNDRKYYVNELNKIEYLKPKPFGFKELEVFENPYFKPQIYITDVPESLNKDIPYRKVEFEKINPTKYIVKLKNVRGNFYLNFSENYNPNWTLKIGKFKFTDVFRKNYLLEKGQHIKSAANLNSYNINTDDLCNKSDCITEVDGTRSVSLTIFYKPQIFFYIGLMISVASLFLLLSILLYLVVNNEKKN